MWSRGGHGNRAEQTNTLFLSGRQIDIRLLGEKEREGGPVFAVRQTIRQTIGVLLQVE